MNDKNYIFLFSSYFALLFIYKQKKIFEIWNYYKILNCFKNTPSIKCFAILSRKGIFLNNELDFCCHFFFSCFGEDKFIPF